METPHSRHHKRIQEESTSSIPHVAARGETSTRAQLPIGISSDAGGAADAAVSSSLTDSPLDFIDERPSIDNPRTTEFVNSLVKIAGVASAKQRQQLLQRQESCPVSTSYGLPLIPRQSEEKEDPWFMSRRSSRLNLDVCDVEVESPRAPTGNGNGNESVETRGRPTSKPWSASCSIRLVFL